MSIREFKLILAGDPGVGKEQFIRRHQGGFGHAKRNPVNFFVNSYGRRVHPLFFCTNYGAVRFNVLIPTKEDSILGLENESYKHSQCAIIMFDVTSRITYGSVPKWHRYLTDVSPNIPIVLVGNRVEIKDRKVKAKQITFHRKKNNLQYYDISPRASYNFEKPFLWISQKLSGRNDLHFVTTEQLKVLMLAAIQESASPRFHDLAHHIMSYVDFGINIEECRPPA